MEMIPGLNQVARKLPQEELGDQQLKRIEAIIRSMTPAERHDPRLIDGSRRRRIARGSGTSTQEVNQLLNQFRDMQKMMKNLPWGGSKGKGPRGGFQLPNLPFGM
jgi:signal recognition particle subunit SRP54